MGNQLFLIKLVDVETKQLVVPSGDTVNCHCPMGRTLLFFSVLGGWSV